MVQMGHGTQAKKGDKSSKRSGLLQWHDTVFFVLFCFGHAACKILVPPPGIEPVPPAVEVRSPNHWTTREFPTLCISLLGLPNTVP